VKTNFIVPHKTAIQFVFFYSIDNIEREGKPQIFRKIFTQSKSGAWALLSSIKNKIPKIFPRQINMETLSSWSNLSKIGRSLRKVGFVRLWHSRCTCVNEREQRTCHSRWSLHDCEWRLFNEQCAYNYGKCNMCQEKINGFVYNIREDKEVCFIQC
jgi:hypothetical protein